MPDADISLLVVNAHGHQRDFEHRAQLRSACRENVSREKLPEREPPSNNALRVTVFEPDTSKKPGIPIWDRANYIGLVVVLVQCGIAAIPWGVSSNYFPFIVTVSGTMLSLLSGATPQWGNEKFASYKLDAWTVALTRGNGSRHVMMVLGRDHRTSGGLDLEIMATRNRGTQSSYSMRAVAMLLTALWTVLLITVAGIKADTWCMYHIPYIPFTADKMQMYLLWVRLEWFKTYTLLEQFVRRAL